MIEGSMPATQPVLLSSWKNPQELPVPLLNLLMAKKIGCKLSPTLVIPSNYWPENLNQLKTLSQKSLQELAQAYESLNSRWVRLGWCDEESIRWLEPIAFSNGFLHELGNLVLEKGLSNKWLIAQACDQIIAHGWLETRYTTQKQGKVIRVEGWPGFFHQQVVNHEPAILLINPSDSTIRLSQASKATLQAQATDEGSVELERLNTLFNLPNSTFLSLSAPILNLKRNFTHHLKIEWVLLANQNVEIVNIAPLSAESTAQPAINHAGIYISTGSIGELTLTANFNVSGIGLLRSDYLWANLGYHPLWYWQKRKGEFKKFLLKYFQQANQSYPTQRIVYRLQNLNTQELRELTYGSKYEDEEINPYMGKRGMHWYLQHPDFFHFELQTFKQWAEKRVAPSGLLVPFVRDDQEWQRCLAEITKAGLFELPFFELWLQLNTPENVWRLPQYLRPNLTGVLVHVQTIIGLARGIDPDDAILQLEHSDTHELTTSVLTQVNQHLNNSTHSGYKLILCDNPEPFLLELGVNLGYDGFVVAPQAGLVVQNRVIHFEAERLKKASLWQ